MIAVFALHHIAQKIASIDGRMLPLDWMPFICSTRELEDIQGFLCDEVFLRDLPDDCLEWLAICAQKSSPSPSPRSNTGRKNDPSHDACKICDDDRLSQIQSNFESTSSFASNGNTKCPNIPNLPNVIRIYHPQSIASWQALSVRSTSRFIEALDAWNRSAFARKFLTRRGNIDLTTPQIMGIWNVAPDSFSSFCETDDAASIAHGEKVLEDGAQILDIGAESTRPQSAPVDSDEERKRLASPLQWASKRPVPISLDTRHLETMRWALDNEYIDIVNDVALSNDVTRERDGAVLQLVRDAHAGYIAMAYEPHDAPELDFEECAHRISHQLAQRLDMAWTVGCDMRQIVVDPGIGFGKGLSNDLRLITESMKFLSILGRPVLIAHSRKRCLARATGLSIESLDTATAIASGLSFALGAAVVRVHAPNLSRIALAISQAHRSRP